MNSNALRGRCPLPRGFTLLELLVVLAILSLLSTIALGHVGKVREGAVKNVRDRRNARTLCTVAASAETLGLKLVVPGDVAATIDNLVKGGTVPDGIFAGTVMAVPSLSEDEKVTAALYLRFIDGMLVYEGFPTED